jgi:hypothetical protein
MTLIILCGLFGLMHLIATLSYGVRIAGARTGRVALCLSLFNILVLFSRSSHTLLTPALSKRLESSIGEPEAEASLLGELHWLLWAASIATLIGIGLIPTFQRFVTTAVERFEKKGSMLRLAAFVLSPVGATALVRSAAVPSRENWRTFAKNSRTLPWGVLAMNVGGSALLAAGVLSALYAGVLAPEYRMTTGQLSAVVNFVGTLLLFALVDPYLSYLTDTTSAGETPQSRLRLHVAAMGVSRLLGTVLAHLVLLPGASMIAAVARWIPG